MEENKFDRRMLKEGNNTISKVSKLIHFDAVSSPLLKIIFNKLDKKLTKIASDRKKIFFI